MPEYHVRRTVVCIEQALVTADDPFAAHTTSIIDEHLDWRLYEAWQPVVLTVHTLDDKQVFGVDTGREATLHNGIKKILEDNYDACGGLGEEQLLERLQGLLDEIDAKKDPKAPIRG
jgi:hypothetical protein